MREIFIGFYLIGVIQVFTGGGCLNSSSWKNSKLGFGIEGRLGNYLMAYEGEKYHGLLHVLLKFDCPEETLDQGIESKPEDRC